MISEWFREVFYPPKQREIFHIERHLMRLVKIWPGDSLINFPFLSVYILGFFFIEIPSSAYILTSKDEFVHVAVSICELIQMTVYLLKMVNILFNRQELMELITKLQLNYKALSHKSKKLHEFYDNIQRRSYLLIIAYICLVFGALIAYFYFPILIDFIKVLLGRTDLQYPFVLKANYLVIDPRRDGITFVIYTILSRMYINIFLYGFFIMDLFLVTLSFYVSSYLEAVKLQMRHLHLEEDFLSEEEVTSRLINVISDHVVALKMARSLDTVIRNNMITQFVLFSLSFCFVLFNLTYVIEDAMLFISCFAVTVVTQVEQFVFAFYGNKIQTESRAVGFEAYNLKWYKRSVKHQKLIIDIIQRSQDKTVVITAGKFYAVDLESFGAALQTSLGYFAMIKTVYGQI